MLVQVTANTLRVGDLLVYGKYAQERLAVTGFGPPSAYWNGNRTAVILEGDAMWWFEPGARLLVERFDGTAS